MKKKRLAAVLAALLLVPVAAWYGLPELFRPE